MGRQKALLRVEGRTFVRRILDTLREGGIDGIETRDEGGQLPLIGTRVEHDAPGASGDFPGRFGVLGTKDDGDVVDPAVAQRVENAADERPALHP